MRLDLDVELARAPGEAETSVALLGRPLGLGREGFERLDTTLTSIYGKQRDVYGRIDAGGEVPHRDVIRCLDSFLLAAAKQVDFVGTPRRAR